MHPRERLSFSSSILPPRWPKSVCHKREASTFPCRGHLLKMKRLSTLSKEAVSDNPDISQRHRRLHCCFITGFFSSCSQLFCNKLVINTCKCWQLFRFTPPMCKLLNFPGSYSFSRRKSMQFAPFRLDITDFKAIAR